MSDDPVYLPWNNWRKPLLWLKVEKAQICKDPNECISCQGRRHVSCCTALKTKLEHRLWLRCCTTDCPSTYKSFNPSTNFHLSKFRLQRQPPNFRDQTSFSLGEYQSFPKPSEGDDLPSMSQICTVGPARSTSLHGLKVHNGID